MAVNADPTQFGSQTPTAVMPVSGLENHSRPRPCPSSSLVQLKFQPGYRSEDRVSYHGCGATTKEVLQTPPRPLLPAFQLH